MRPRTLAELVGQAHLLGPGKLLRRALEARELPSLILWGPPGTGKTTLGRLLAAEARARFVPLSAVMAGVKDLREAVAEAATRRDQQGERTVLFVDEIHRFNKGQQDALLPHVEAGTIVLIGATTENPSFEVNAALLSRAKVVVLHALSDADLRTVIDRALTDTERGLGGRGVAAADDVRDLIVRESRGDARRALTTLEAAAAVAVPDAAGQIVLTAPVVEEASQKKTILYDKAGDEHYGVVSAFIKSLRGSDPDAAVYWMARMIEAGEDPLFVLRRLVIFAAEDIGVADPRALSVATAALDAFRFIGLPEGILPMTEAASIWRPRPRATPPSRPTPPPRPTSTRTARCRSRRTCATPRAAWGRRSAGAPTTATRTTSRGTTCRRTTCPRSSRSPLLRTVGLRRRARDRRPPGPAARRPTE